MRTRIPSLSPRQTRLIHNTAETLPLDRREDFVRSVHARLAGEPADYAVQVAVNAALTLIPSDKG
jgi:hypothetical protein